MLKTARFGCFELDMHDGSLRKNGRRLHIQSQPFRVLAALIEASGATVTREQLKALIWPSDTFVEFDKSLNTAVMKIRQALDDSAHSPRYLETVPRLGYRFLAPVTIIGETALPIALPPEISSTTEPIALARPRLGKSIVLGFSGCAAIGLILFLSLRVDSSHRSFLPSIPVTSFAGSEITPSFSPNAERVAFAWDGERQNNFDVYIKEINAGTKGITAGHLTRVTNDSHPDLSPVWSPDGRSIAFVRVVSESRAEIMIVSTIAATPERSVASISAPNPYYERFKLLAWSPDSKNLVFTSGKLPGGAQELFLLRLKDGSRRRLTSPPADYDDLSPAFSADGLKLAFVRYSGKTSGDLFVLPLSHELQPAGSPRRATFYNRLAGTPAWSEDGRRLVFTRYDMPGIPSLWRMPWPTTGGAEPLLISSDTSLSLDLSRNSRRLIYTREAWNVNIWAIHLGEKWKAHTPGAWSQNSFVDYNPQFSPDGKRVAFSSTRSGHCEIWVAGRDGYKARQMTHTNGTVSGFPRWSPDGRGIVFHLRLKTAAALYTLDLDDDHVSPLPILSGGDSSPSYSRDGNWIYFVSRRTGDYQLWKVRRTGGAPVQITRNGGLTPIESLDRQYLYYTKPGSFHIWRRPVTGGPETLVSSHAVAAKGTAYAVAKNGIYFISAGSKGIPWRLMFLSFKTSKCQAVANLPRSVELGLTLSPDEKTVLYSQQDRIDSDLMLVENFR